MRKKNLSRIDTTINSIDLHNVLNTSRDRACEKVVDIYLSLFDSTQLSEEEIANDILQVTQYVIGIHNAYLDKSERHLKWQMPKNILPFQVAKCMIARDNVVNLINQKTNKSQIAIYVKDEDKYITSTNQIDALILKYTVSYTKGVMQYLKILAPEKYAEEMLC
jgi:hypothetical protein